MFTKSRVPHVMLTWVCALQAATFNGKEAHCQHLVQDGTFDNLTSGPLPDCDIGAGAWVWPATYIKAGICEHYQSEVQLVSKDVSTGELNDLCLRLEGINDPETDLYHIPHIFAQPLHEETSGIITLTFEVLIEEDFLAGGSVYLSGDHGGLGYDYFSDRGPQLFFDAGGAQGYYWGQSENGYFPPVTEEIPLQYVVGEWELVRMDVDLVSDTYDLWLAPDGSELRLVGKGLRFRSGYLDHIDRVTVANFGLLSTQSVWFVDNFRVIDNTDCNENAISDQFEPQHALGDFNGDTVVDLSDHQNLGACLGGPLATPFPWFGRCDWLCLNVFDSDTDGDVDLLDLAEFQNTLSDR